MSKLKRGAKSDAVREYLAANLEAGPKEVVANLKEKGIVVTEALVSKIKYGKKAGQAPSGKRRKSAGRKGKGGMTGSEAIRQYLAHHPGAKAREIHEGLRDQGIKVSLGLVSFVKYKSGKKAGRPSVRIAARRTAPAAISVVQLLDVKRLVDSLGSAAHVRQALDTLEQLQ